MKDRKHTSLPVLRILFYLSVIFSSIPLFSFANHPKIVVIGGGIAGLTTAYRLNQKGMDIDLYEARNRIGGRIFTTTINGCTAELGGQNISDGGDAVNVNRLIDEFRLERICSHIPFKRAYFNGKDLIPIHEILKDRKIDPETLKKELDQLASTSCNMKEVLEGIVDPQDPLYKILAVKIAAYEGGTVEKLSPIYKDTLFHMLLGGICSVHQGNGEGDASINLITVKGGNALLPQKIGEALGSKLHLNMPLTKVSKGTNGSFQLTFQNGTEVEADIVVLAIPCTVYEQIIFEDGIIPPQKLEAIQNVHYGENAKILVPFMAPTTSAVTGLIGDEMLSFFDGSLQILTLYYTGATSYFSPETIANSYDDAYLMIKQFENYPSFAFPTYAKDEANLSFDGPVGYSWPNDPYVKGSYSYIAKGQETILTSIMEYNGEIFKTLFAPLNQNLYFAGEHTSILFDVPGTMEAACESGERIARAILQQHRE